MRIASSRWRVCWVVGALDVAREYIASMKFGEIVDAFEDIVCVPIFASAFPPPFDHASVVTKQLDVPFVLGFTVPFPHHTPDKEFEANRLSPSDVSTFCVPPLA